MRKSRKVTAVVVCACGACILGIVFWAFVLSGVLARGGAHTTSLANELLQVDLPFLVTPTVSSGSAASSAPVTVDNTGNVLTGIYDGLTFILVLVSIMSIIVSRKQSQDALAEGRKQSKETLDLAREQIEQSKLPILIPLSALPQTAVTSQLDYTNAELKCTCLNVGTGVALNIWGVLVPPKRLPQAPYSFSSQAHFLPGNDAEVTFRLGQFHFFAESDKFGAYNPWPSEELTPFHGSSILKYTARLTLTYLDVFGNKYASIYDYTVAGEWKVVKHFRVERDLEDMYKAKEAKLIAQQVI